MTVAIGAATRSNAVTADALTSDWDADQYLRFEAERTRPAADLLVRVLLTDARRCIDLGCGPGNSTELISGRFPDAVVTGLDNSPGMLSKARRRLSDLTFEEADIATWWPGERFDLIFANDVLQWLPHQQRILTRLVSFLNHGGCLAVQVPDSADDPSRRLMEDVASDGSWAEKLSATSVTEAGSASIDRYYECLQGTGSTFDLWETTYLHPLAGPEAIVELFKGAELRPYLHLLDDGEREEFLGRYRTGIAKAYPAQEDGKVLLRLQRVFIVATRSQTRRSSAPWPPDPGTGQRKARVVEMETTVVSGAIRSDPGEQSKDAWIAGRQAQPCRDQVTPQFRTCGSLPRNVELGRLSQPDEGLPIRCGLSIPVQLQSLHTAGPPFRARP
jgi:trans-aconitate 2-methyltransferase